VGANERFWPARLRWRLRGATMWPAFIVLTPLDGVVLHLLPPVKLGLTADGMTVVFGIIVATFGNLVLVGVVAPWLARRLAARARGEERERLPERVRLEALQDRVGTALLGVGLVGLVAAGLGSRPVVVSETRATETNARAVQQFIERSGNPELIRNLEAANTIKLGEGLFRSCVPRDSRRSSFCLLVDTKRKPASVRVDPSGQPNEQIAPTPGY
jgi:hypothetical protein